MYSRAEYQPKSFFIFSIFSLQKEQVDQASAGRIRDKRPGKPRYFKSHFSPRACGGILQTCITLQRSKQTRRDKASGQKADSRNKPKLFTLYLSPALCSYPCLRAIGISERQACQDEERTAQRITTFFGKMLQSTAKKINKMIHSVSDLMEEGRIYSIQEVSCSCIGPLLFRFSSRGPEMNFSCLCA